MVAGVLLLVSGARQLVGAGDAGGPQRLEVALDDVVLDPPVVRVVAELARAGRDESPAALSRLAGAPVCDTDAPTVACAAALQVLGTAPAAGGAVIRPMPDVPGRPERI